MEENVFVKNKNGLKITVVVYRPNKEGTFPVVVLIHGFTGYKDETHISAIARDLANNNFVAVRFDTSGFGESEGTTEKDYRLSNQYSDIESVFEYVKSLNFVDSERLGIWGQSLGGTLAIIFASNNSWIKAICVVSAPTMFARKDNFERRTKAWKEIGYFEKVSSKWGHIKIPYDFVTDSQKWSALDSIRKITKPILFILGSADENVYPKNTKEIYNLANEPKQLIEIQEMKHDYKNVPEQIVEVNNHVIKFFKANI